MDAENAPVRRPPKELHTDDLRKPKIDPAATHEDYSESQIVTADEGDLFKDHAAQLAFNEQPVTIRLERGASKFAPKVVPVWVNGKGAEVLINGKWVEMQGVPVAMPVTLKRKYVEVLAKSVTHGIRTESGKIDNQSERNEIHTDITANHPLSIVKDSDPRGLEWYQKLLAA